jgi:hypothetical protein
MQKWLRSFRRAELRGTSRQNPQELIGLYQAAAGLDPVSPLPPGLTVHDMIESILNKEEGDSLSSGVLRAIAG